MATFLRRSFLVSVLALSAGCSVETKPSGGGGTAPSSNGHSSANSDSTAGSSAAAEPATKLSGEVIADGSSTVFPITQAVAEEFMKTQKDVKVSVGIKGTGGGFKLFVVGDIDINDASRPISDKEIAECQKNGIEYVELKVAIDGLSVVVHPDNNWCKAITVAQLKALWSPGSTVKKWKDLDPNWPDAEIKLYGPGPDSGTFDYFTEVIVGKAKSSRSEYEASEDDNVLVKGVSGDKYSLGYFGFAYYEDNADKVKLVAVAEGDDVSQAVTPSIETILDGTYKPLSRPLYIYVNKKSFEKPQVKEFVKYYISKGQDFVKEVQYIQLPENDLKEAQERLAAALGGTK